MIVASTPKLSAIPTQQLEQWGIQLSRLQRLLAVADDHLGEDIPYCEAARRGVDTVSAVIDGAAAVVGRLARELEDAQGADEA